MSKHEVKFSVQQRTFIDFAINDHRSAKLIAVAGAGKTTTLLEAAEKMPGQVAICAYNKKIADEVAAKLAQRGVTWRKVQSGTVHSFGFSALKKAFGLTREDVDEYKVIDIVTKLVEDNEEVKPYATMIAKLVGLAKQRAVGVTSAITDRNVYREIIDHFDVLDDLDGEYFYDVIIEHAIRALQLSNADTRKIDFDDMVYLPVLHRVKVWKFDAVFVDEAQDTNEARRLLVAMLVKKRGRMFAVGDPHQAIYGFTGADNTALDALGRMFNAVDIPLTVSYRCPKAVVAFARQWVKHIEPHPDAPEGIVHAQTFEQFVERKDLNAKAAVLCRTTRPLVATAFTLIRKKIACRIEGRSIGTNLTKMATRWKRIKNLPDLRDRLDKYFAAQKPALEEARKDAKLQELEDQIETLKVIIDHCIDNNKPMVADVVQYINELFADDVKGVLTLLTIHKSKGMEFDRVFWLDREGTCPSKYAKQPWQKAQEENLCYVAATRAIKELVDLSPKAD